MNSIWVSFQMKGLLSGGSFVISDLFSLERGEHFPGQLGQSIKNSEKKEM